MIEFKLKAHTKINSLLELFENIYKDCEFDLIDEVLDIQLPNKKQYIVNAHSPTEQIWLSSPVSGAHYFSYDQAMNNWVNKSSITLEDLLNTELKQVCL